MKKVLLCLLAAMVISPAKSQIIITGFMSDPTGSDATSTSPGFEYVQLMATEDITFSTSNAYSVVFSRNADSSTPDAFTGWNTGGSRTFKFNLTSGTVNKGEFFYVGGSEKVIAGYLRIGSPLVTYKSTDISAANWIRVISYYNGSTYNGTSNTATLGDDFGGSAPDWLYNRANYLSGIAVFATTNVTSTTVPIDAVFLGDAAYIAADEPYVSDEEPGSLKIGRLLDIANSKGYMVPDNDLYKTTDGSNPQPYFGQGTNTTVLDLQPAADKGYFAKLGGIYNTDANKWTTARSIYYVALLDGSSTNAADASVPQLSDIETDADPSKITQLDDTPLPVKLVSFDAKKQSNRILLSWATASEQNNHHFDVLRSADGKDFNLIGERAGKGTTHSATTYTYEDNSPVSGLNYYKLRQVDYDGKSTELAVTSVNAGFAPAGLNVYASADGQYLNVSVNTERDDKGTIYITDLSGRKLVEQKVNLEKGQTQARMPLVLQNGIYVVTLQTSAGQTSAKFRL